ncbi:HAMP domain-containing sensor histidine kinase [Telmatospirillum sp. J64-1]|uniref:sensor histidine kinase n=1 Tax=Telmatospirillum sp. J64-1 TaxID=2502183 RepID=UPI0021044C3B|nr:HAMP domain-containing sensor histidine kinase [Telmatospirillum sp. J64-1]
MPHRDDGGTFARIRRAANSLTAKLLLLVAIFVAVPVILHGQFRQAEMERRTVLLQTLQEQGHLIAQSLRRVIDQPGSPPITEARRVIEDMHSDRLRVKLLFRPLDAPEASFFLVATLPSLANEGLERERAELFGTGILDRLRGTCAGEGAVALRYNNLAGEEEILSSITPVQVESGCWAVITSHSMADVIGSYIGKPYYERPEVQLAFAIYIIMAVLVLAIFGDVLRGLSRFRRLASRIDAGGRNEVSFAAQNRLPELAGVAEAFDRMVENLRASARSIRYAAEENAHAFKTPIATISQAIEPIRRALPKDAANAQRSLEVIEKSMLRLDSLVGAVRIMDQAVAELVSPPREKVDLSALTNTMIESYGESLAGSDVRISGSIDANAVVRGGEEMLETVLENILDNAVSFSPPGSTIDVTLRRASGVAVLSVEDEGPGVEPGMLNKIFQRYFSYRPAEQERNEPQDATHFGIGLWVVKRNLEAIGGSIRAENRVNGGLRMVITLPLAK